jgi:TonB family protein
MMAALMIYALAIAVPLAGAALLLDRAAALGGRPRRWIWAGTLAALVVLPAAMPWRAAPAGPVPRAAISATADVAAQTPPPAGRWADAIAALRTRVDAVASGAARIDALIEWAWILASLSLLIAYVGSRWALGRRRRAWLDAVVDDVPVLIAPDTGPAVIGVWASRIVLPAWTTHLDPRARQLLLRHEQAHQRARDPLLLHAAGFAVILTPWNPLAWWLASRLRLAVELDCDARVLDATRAPGSSMSPDLEAYGELLLTVASHPGSRGSRFAPALLERPSALSRRIAAMSRDTSRVVVVRILTAAIAAGGLVATTLAAPVPTAQDKNAPRVYDKDTTPDLVNPVVATRVRPVYTPEAMRHKIQGAVQLEAVVNEDGTVGDCRITKSLDAIYGLDEEAVTALRQWTFTPGRLHGDAVPVRVAITLTFTLH